MLSEKKLLTSSSAAQRIIEGSRRPAALGATPEGVISLSMGEPDCGTPAPIVESAIEALRRGRTRYSKLTGSPELQSALASYLSDKARREVTPDQVVITHGGSAGLAASVLALLDPGDRVLVPEPTYSLYADHLALVGAETAWIANLADGGLDLGRIALEAPASKMIILCNPGNPTGRVYSPADLDALGEILKRNPHLLLLADEAYSEIVFDGLTFQSAIEMDSVQDQVVLSQTFSKTYAMTGWRLGYIVAPAELASRINLVHRSLNGALNTFVQDAAVTALATPLPVLKASAASYQARRDIVVEHLDGLPGVTMLLPQGAFYAFPRIESTLSSDEMTRRFAEAGILVRSGSEFGPSGEGHIRISFATDPESLHEGMRRFTDALESMTDPRP